MNHTRIPADSKKIVEVVSGLEVPVQERPLFVGGVRLKQKTECFQTPDQHVQALQHAKPVQQG